MCLNGSWFNELGSHIQISVDADGTTLRGSYQPPVGLASGRDPPWGYCNPRPDGGSTALGFTVVWHNESSDAGSVTAWSGQYQTVDGEEVISAVWLLTQETDPDDNWKSTLVGEDIFARRPPSKDHGRMARGPASHPHSA